MTLAILLGLWGILSIAVFLALGPVPPLRRRPTLRAVLAPVTVIVLFALDALLWREVALKAATAEFGTFVSERADARNFERPESYAVGYLDRSELVFAKVMLDRVEALYTSRGGSLFRVYHSCPANRTCEKVSAIDAYVDTAPDRTVEYVNIFASEAPYCEERRFFLNAARLCFSASYMGGKPRVLSAKLSLESSLTARIWENPSWDLKSPAWFSIDYVFDECTLGGTLTTPPIACPTAIWRAEP